MIIEKIDEESVYLEYAEEIKYFYFASDPKMNNKIFVSDDQDDFRSAAESLHLNNTPISCYKIIAARPEWQKLRAEKEIAMKNGIMPFNPEEYPAPDYITCEESHIVDEDWNGDEDDDE